jgi:sulfite exporter TauE/SafE
MILAFALGLTGSLSHCVGMCSAVILMLKRHPAFAVNQASWPLVHAGRLTSYMLIGGLAGFAGQLLGLQLNNLQNFQGLIAMMTAIPAIYFSLGILGVAPSADRLMPNLTAAWGRRMRGAVNSNSASKRKIRLAPYSLGLLWGLLPCGLVLAAVFTAAVSTSPWVGTLRMLAFGLGTLPALAGVQFLSRKLLGFRWPRYAASAAMLIFGLQFIFRGLASWGLMAHMKLGEVMLW